MKPKQLTLFQNKIYQKRKVARVVSTKQFMHIVMKARFPVLRQNHEFIKTIIKKEQIHWGIKIKNIAIQPDHIHLCVKVSSRIVFFNFMRVVAGVIGKKLLRRINTNQKVFVRKGIYKQFKTFWKQRVWTRIVHFGKDLRGVLLYIAQNPFKAGLFNQKIDRSLLVDGILQI